MKLQRFHIKIENGRILFKSQEHKDMFGKYLSQWDGQMVEIEIFQKRSKRSEQQNAYYWLYLNIISKELGDDKDSLHSYFKNKFLTTGITELYGDKVRMTKSTTELSKGEFCNYLVEIAALTQIELPDTTEYWGYSYHK